MTCKVFNLNNVPFGSSRKLLIDTNVLLYLQTGDTHSYDKMWDLAIRQKNQLFITSLTISEFINYYCRTAYHAYTEKYEFDESEFQYKKDYQKTNDFKEHYFEAIDTLETEVFPRVRIIDFVQGDFENLKKFTEYMYDLNDALFMKLALREGYSIVTHDADFFSIPIKESINVYTYNK
ncbi:PilT domain-containing protein [Streptococcus mutans 15VF2]|uniref:type II toxin-antitoxin system VapC family toxin n=1 Tax=Streptococcus mutans TaxID=1309 RepID=UPI0002B52BA9|nr:PIN domain-containing protein [Streptococcus mutans]EMB58525.1 PilT domain-containing protein [Streptococcus mutans 15JP3]EMB72271.1 PilT domain-containing protein [Streptococcus mutans 15VF2]